MVPWQALKSLMITNKNYFFALIIALIESRLNSKLSGKAAIDLAIVLVTIKRYKITYSPSY